MKSLADVFQAALQHHQAGRFQEAETLYRQILQAQPTHADALHLLGVIAHQTGKHEIAVEHITRAIALNPGAVEYHCNIGEVYRAQGKLEEAVAHYREAIARHPAYAEAHCNLGIALNALGKASEAMSHYRQALALKPAFAEAYSNMGNVFQEQGNLTEAMAHYRQALALKPTYAEAHCNLGIALNARGNPSEAMVHYRQALMLKPTYAEAHCNLGNALKAQGKLEESVVHYRQALALTPHDVVAQMNLAAALYSQGQTLDAIVILLNGLANQPTNVQLRHTLAIVLNCYELHVAGEQVRVILLSLLHDDDISSQNLATAVTGLVRNSPSFPPLLNAAKSGVDPFLEAVKEVDAFTHEPLLLAALPRLVICNAELEQVLTHLRRVILLRSSRCPGRPAADPDVSYPFLCALAMQCFNTEYAWFVSRDEARMVDNLRTTLKSVLRRPVKDLHALERSLVLFALYDSLHNLPGWERLLKPELSQWSKSFQLIVREQVHNHKEEQDIGLRLKALTEVQDEVSRKVTKMYEENPYPRWITIQRPQALTVESLAATLRPGAKLCEFPRPASILVAGCGTGHHPIQVAMTFKEGEVLAVDLSRTSLAYAVRMAERLGVTNITFQQADILELGALDRRFAVIECGGVLHHLKDPLKGWRVLAGLLEPDGLMKIALYSAIGRRNIQAARNFARARKFPSTPEGVRKCRRAILGLPEEHPAHSVLLLRDFYSISGCRDLLMHVQEKHFTLRDIADSLDQLNLRFVGFLCDVQLLSRFRSMFPGDAALSDLVLWDRFEEANPGSFSGMYQFWCCRK